MPELTIAAAAAPFDRDLEACFRTIGDLLDEARDAGAGLVVLPEAALGGYVESLSGDEPDGPPPPRLDADGPELKRLCEMAGELTVCVGFAEDGGEDVTYNSAACVTGDGVLYVHRKVHLPLREDRYTTRGDQLRAFDTPVGRIAMLICYDKAFPEAARTLALDGASILCTLSSWPMSATNPAEVMTEDRQWRLAQLWDRSRAAENDFIVASANQTGTFGSLRFLGGARIVATNGTLLAETGTEPGLAIHTLDVDAAVAHGRRALSPIKDRRPDLYRLDQPLPV